MRLLASTDFALRVLIRLAEEPAGQHLSVEALARELGGLSRNHLHKVVQDLALLGMVRTLRGAHGGVALSKPPGEIRLGALVRGLEAGQALVECFRADGGACVLTPRCRLKGMLGGAQNAFLSALDQYTLAECLAGAAAPPLDPAPRGGPGPQAAHIEDKGVRSRRAPTPAR
jgi:Rrf2 family nitric oxide-sensitive transcriptional repressor